MNFSKYKNRKSDKKVLLDKSENINNYIMNNHNYSYYYYHLYNKNKIKKVIPDYFNIKKQNKKSNNKTKIKASKEIKYLVRDNNNPMMDCKYCNDLSIDIKKSDIKINLNNDNIENNNKNNYKHNKEPDLLDFNGILKSKNPIKQDDTYQRNISTILYSLIINNFLNRKNLSDREKNNNIIDYYVDDNINNKDINSNVIDDPHSIPIVNKSSPSLNNTFLLNNIYYQKLLSHPKKTNMSIKNFNSNLNFNNNKNGNFINFNNFNQNNGQIKCNNNISPSQDNYNFNKTNNLINIKNAVSLEIEGDTISISSYNKDNEKSNIITQSI
ncbi:hypothetical protein BCR36DRAFT_371055 [Piromyces finnis]|uniref:Uncharacterized protein n=1 Tax=Piromyces finnis TaxID=1754191 RepID=A0A1Y1V7I6_9FUNG|nr:hypothetical protein BCR36DRAFT_371055 [Piromyces finnis]|eukprot:ORX48990.1 hypothetical protein BCR36DRAFT_371055 [Piromyces finnis]